VSTRINDWNALDYFGMLALVVSLGWVGGLILYSIFAQLGRRSAERLIRASEENRRRGREE